MNPNLLLVSTALLLLPAAAVAQCTDPTVPQGGFALTSVLNQPVTYGDTAKTLMDVRYPAARPGSCGWPVVIIVHGAGSSRTKTIIVAEAEYYAAQGYVTVAYDVRGQGDALKLNPATLGSEGFGRSERLDLAEIVALVKTRFGSVADVSRLGITGLSQGAAHSWAAAAYSGRALPTTNNRGIKTFPKFLAAVPVILAPISAELLVVDGKAFTAGGVISHMPSPNFEFEPTYHNRMLAALRAGNAAAAAAILTNDPWRQDLAYLKTSIVPVMAHAMWNDVFGPVDLSVNALNAMPSTTPTRAFLSTYGHHGEPRNPRQVSQSRSFALRWFDRFLKGIKNQVDTEPRFVSGVVPATDDDYRNPNTLLWHRYHSSWGPAGTNRLKFYIRQGQALSTRPPTTPEIPQTIRHRVTAGWDMARFINGGARGSALAQAVALSTTSYDTPPQASPLEIVGSPSMVLEVSPTASSTDYQLHCALYQVPANGPERYLQSGVAVVTGNSKAQRLTVDFHDIHAYVPAGDKLRLKIENLTHRYPAGLPKGRFSYYTIPFFVNADVALEHTTARPSWLEIPVARTIQPALTSATLDIDTRIPADVVFNLDGTPLLAGGSYLLAFGASGIGPGTALPGGGTALLNADAVTLALLPSLNTAFLPNGIGTLNAKGQAAVPPRIALGSFPSLGSFVGLRLNAIALVTANNRVLASNPLDLFFR